MKYLDDDLYPEDPPGSQMAVAMLGAIMGLASAFGMVMARAIAAPAGVYVLLGVLPLLACWAFWVTRHDEGWVEDIDRAIKFNAVAVGLGALATVWFLL